MSDCTLIREAMPQLLTQALPSAQREASYLHIEHCAACAQEWQEMREAWRLMETLPEVPLPARVRDAFFLQLSLSQPARVVAFPTRRAPWWLAQAAAAVLVAAGAFWAGQRSEEPIARTPATVASVTPAPFSLAESRVLAASQVAPEIQGRPDIQNVRFFETPGKENGIGVSFDLTSKMTITGDRNDPSLVGVLSYMLQNQNNSTPSRSDAIEWVKEAYGSQSSANPEIVKALASVLKNDTHEGVRIKAVETLKSLPSSLGGEARAALIDALHNDPNPAVRIKAVEALAKLSTSGSVDSATVDSLRQKAAQEDENLYVRVKAAEALSRINL